MSGVGDDAKARLGQLTRHAPLGLGPKGVRVHTPDDQWIVWDLDINGDGRYALDMSDKHDVRPGDEVQVFYGAWLDNQTGRSYWVQRQGIYLPVVINK